MQPLEAAVILDAYKLSTLGATALLHFVGYEVMKGQGTITSWLEQRFHVDWRERTARSLHSALARAVGQKRLETYRALWAQVLHEFDGDDLLDDQRVRHRAAT